MTTNNDTKFTPNDFPPAPSVLLNVFGLNLSGSDGVKGVCDVHPSFGNGCYENNDGNMTSSDNIIRSLPVVTPSALQEGGDVPAVVGCHNPSLFVEGMPPQRSKKRKLKSEVKRSKSLVNTKRKCTDRYTGTVRLKNAHFPGSRQESKWSIVSPRTTAERKKSTRQRKVPLEFVEFFARQDERKEKLRRHMNRASSSVNGTVHDDYIFDGDDNGVSEDLDMEKVDDIVDDTHGSDYAPYMDMLEPLQYADFQCVGGDEGKCVRIRCTKYMKSRLVPSLKLNFRPLCAMCHMPAVGETRLRRCDGACHAWYHEKCVSPPMDLWKSWVCSMDCVREYGECRFPGPAVAHPLKSMSGACLRLDRSTGEMTVTNENSAKLTVDAMQQVLPSMCAIRVISTPELSCTHCVERGIKCNTSVYPCDGCLHDKFECTFDGFLYGSDYVRAVHSIPQRTPRVPERLLNDKWRKSNESPEEAVCCICQSGVSDERNQIVFCDGECGQAYHQDCLDIVVLPERDWFCRVSCMRARTRKLEEYRLLKSRSKVVRLIKPPSKKRKATRPNEILKEQQRQKLTEFCVSTDAYMCRYVGMKCLPLLQPANDLSGQVNPEVFTEVPSGDMNVNVAIEQLNVMLEQQRYRNDKVRASLLPDVTKDLCCTYSKDIKHSLDNVLSYGGSSSVPSVPQVPLYEVQPPRVSPSVDAQADGKIDVRKDKPSGRTHSLPTLSESMGVKRRKPSRSMSAGDLKRYANHRSCISCGVEQSTCWRFGDSLCNKCGVRFFRKNLLCSSCLYVPSVSEIRDDDKCRKCGVSSYTKADPDFLRQQANSHHSNNGVRATIGVGVPKSTAVIPTRNSCEVRPVCLSPSTNGSVSSLEAGETFPSQFFEIGVTNETDASTEVVHNVSDPPNASAHANNTLPATPSSDNDPSTPQLFTRETASFLAHTSTSLSWEQNSFNTPRALKFEDTTTGNDDDDDDGGGGGSGGAASTESDKVICPDLFRLAEHRCTECIPRFEGWPFSSQGMLVWEGVHDSCLNSGWNTMQGAQEVDKVFPCPWCPLTFTDHAERVGVHLRMQHYDDCLFYCRICGTQFVREEDRNKHEKKHRGTKSSKMCPYCPASFKNDNLRTIHEYKFHSYKFKQRACYECHHCVKRFRTKAELWDHENHHLALRYSCGTDNCGRTFAKYVDATKHERYCSGQRSNKQRQK